MKAVALVSGGLDSMLAAKLVKDQGIDVQAVMFSNPFSADRENAAYARRFCRRFGIPLKFLGLEEDYLKVIRRPKFGYGSGMNPCIDCKIFMLKKAKAYARSLGARFLITGEVLGERPMSQHAKALRIIEREAKLSGSILRPLSARLLPETEPEKKGWVDRNKLLAISGRSRKPQMALARRFGIKDYPTPGGGCLLTYKEFAKKARDLFMHQKRISMNDVHLLRFGRHFRFGKNRIIVGRNQEDNKKLLELRGKDDYLFFVPGYGSPITLLKGRKTKKVVNFAASLTAIYSDRNGKEVLVKYGRHGSFKRMYVKPAKKSEIRKHMLC